MNRPRITKSTRPWSWNPALAKTRNEPVGDTATARRGRPRSVETTNAILESAYTLMATTRLAATSIDVVARHSNVSKITIYTWWPSREALLIDAFLNQASLMLPRAGTGKPAGRFRRLRLSLVGRIRAGKEDRGGIPRMGARQAAGDR